MLEAKARESAQADDGSAGPLGVAAPRAARKPALIILHQENSNPGHVGQWFLRNGHALDIRKPRFGDPLPRTLEHHCGAVIFGGPMSANDADDFIRAEIDWLDVPLREKKPFLGICLGAQMLTVKLGARVGFPADETAEIGYYPLLTTPEGRHGGGFPAHVYQWHREGCELASGARHLATAPGSFPVQAFSYGPAAVGVQFHPEITYAQVHRWTGRNSSRMGMNGARSREEHIAGHIEHAPGVHAWLDRFLARWVTAEVAAR